MKRLLLILLVMLPFLVRGQNASWKFFDRYTKAEGFTSVQLERKMMRMMSRQAAEKGDEGLSKLLGGIEFIRIVALDKGDGTQFVADAENLATNPEYKFQLVMSGTEEGQTTRFYIREAEFYDNGNGFVKVAEYRNGELRPVGSNRPLWLVELLEYLASE